MQHHRRYARQPLSKFSVCLDPSPELAANSRENLLLERQCQQPKFRRNEKHQVEGRSRFWRGRNIHSSVLSLDRSILNIKLLNQLREAAAQIEVHKSLLKLLY